VPARGSNDDDVVNDETVGAGIQDIGLSKHFESSIPIAVGSCLAVEDCVRVSVSRVSRWLELL
jgi:hypothetical protein